jgi:hypothetical protein
MPKVLTVSLFPATVKANRILKDGVPGLAAEVMAIVHRWNAAAETPDVAVAVAFPDFSTSDEDVYRMRRIQIHGAPASLETLQKTRLEGLLLVPGVRMSITEYGDEHVSEWVAFVRQRREKETVREHERRFERATKHFESKVAEGVQPANPVMSMKDRLRRRPEHTARLNKACRDPLRFNTHSYSTRQDFSMWVALKRDVAPSPTCVIGSYGLSSNEAVVPVPILEF